MDITALKSNKAWTRIKIPPLMKTLQNASHTAPQINYIKSAVACTQVVSCHADFRRAESKSSNQCLIDWRALCKVTNCLRTTMRASRMLKGFSSRQLFRACLVSGCSAAADAPSAHFRSQQVWLIDQLVSQLAKPCLRLLMSSGGTRTLWYVPLGTLSRPGGCCQWICIAMLPF